MKIYPDLIKIWAQRIRHAGTTSYQAQKVLSEAEKTLQQAHNHLKSPSPNNGLQSRDDNPQATALKKLNTF